MDAQIQNQGGKELVERIKANLAERQHRFELQDPFADVTIRFQTADAATAKADQLGTTRFQGRDADGSVTQINKVDGQWVRDDGKNLADIQDEIDRDSARAIEARAEQRAAVGQGLDAEADKQMALADAHAFRRIQNPVWQESAAVEMAHNARAYPEYKIGLDKAIPGYPGTAEKVYALDAAMMSERGEPAKNGTPEVAPNSVEPNIEKEQQQLSEAQDAQRAAWLKKAEEPKPQNHAGSKGPAGNQVESDEIFTATQSEIKPVVPPEIEKQYLRVGDKFYHPKNTDLVAFEDKGNKLETKSNSEAIAESMVRIAEARGWDEIKVSGSETFRKEVWLEAASRGMHVKGYTPSEQDKAELAKRMSQVEANKVEKDNKPFRARENDESKEVKAQAEAPKAEAKPDTPNKRMAESFAKDSSEEAVKKHPELAGAAAAVVAMDKQAEADGLNAQQRAIVMARVRQNVVNSIERGQIPEVKVKEELEVKRDAKEEKEFAR